MVHSRNAALSNDLLPTMVHEEFRPASEPDPMVPSGLDTVGADMTYPRGATLFMEGDKPEHVFLVCAGRIKLYINSREGKTIIVKVAQRGAVLGLSAVLSSSPHELTAEVTEEAKVRAIP